MTMTSKVGKRPLRSLSAHEKMEAIRRVHDGESKASVARDIGVPESTLRGWCKNEDKILYLSRQSTPDTDESDHLPTREKKQRYEATDMPTMQPFNLSVRAPSKSPQPAEPVVVATTIPETLPSVTESTDVPLALNLTKQESPKNVNIPVVSTPVPAVAPSAVDKERERNRAELTRLSIELGLNRPEMFLPNSSNANIAANLSDLSASLTANLGLVAQWNNALLQQVNTKKRTSQTAGLDSISSMQQHPTSQPVVSTTTPMTTTNVSSISTQQQHNNNSSSVHHYNNNSIKPSKSKKQHLDTHNVDDSVWYWLKTQQAMLGLVQNSTTPNTMQQNVVDPTNSSWFWKWYKQLAYGQMQQPATGQVTQQLHQQQQQQPQQQQPQMLTPEKPILYQQLTKESNSENHETPKSTKPSSQNTKVRAVLDNLLLNNNNNEDATTLIENGLQKRDSDGTKTADEATMTPASTAEALCHGEMFLKWLEKCGDPSVTAVQILQLRYLLNNIRTGVDRKNGVSSAEHKNKVRSRK